MGRRNRELVYRIRYKNNLGFRSKLSIGRPNVKIPGRVLRIGKVSQEELFHVGEYNRMPETLMREFKRDNKEVVTS